MHTLLYQETIDLLANILPARALHDLTDGQTGFAPQIVAAGGLHDRTVRSRLESAGLNVRECVERAVEEVLQQKKLPRDSDNIFNAVDHDLRGDGNPLLPHVRRLVEQSVRNAIRIFQA